MIADKIIKGAVKLIAKQFKLDKVLKYVEDDNELDKKVKELENTVAVFNKCFDNVEDSIKKLKKEAHPPIFSKSNLDKMQKRITKLEKR